MCNWSVNKHQRKILIWMCVMMCILLSGCYQNSAKENTLSTAKLTEREKTLLSVGNIRQNLFEFQVDDRYNRVEVWVEKYENGSKTEDVTGKLSTEIQKNGLIYFDFSMASQTKQGHINLAISGEGGTSSSGSDIALSEANGPMNRGWGETEISKMPVNENMALSYVLFSSKNETAFPELFYFEDPSKYMDQIKALECVYVLKCAFISDEH